MSQYCARLLNRPPEGLSSEWSQDIIALTARPDQWWELPGDWRMIAQHPDRCDDDDRRERLYEFCGVRLVLRIGFTFFELPRETAMSWADRRGIGSHVVINATTPATDEEIAALFGYAVIEPRPEAEGGGYRTFFPDYPGIGGTGHTRKEASAAAEAALQSYFDTLKVMGLPIPSPS